MASTTNIIYSECLALIDYSMLYRKCAAFVNKYAVHLQPIEYKKPEHPKTNIMTSTKKARVADTAPLAPKPTPTKKKNTHDFPLTTQPQRVESPNTTGTPIVKNASKKPERTTSNPGDSSGEEEYRLLESDIEDAFKTQKHLSLDFAIEGELNRQETDGEWVLVEEEDEEWEMVEMED